MKIKRKIFWHKTGTNSLNSHCGYRETAGVHHAASTTHTHTDRATTVICIKRYSLTSQRPIYYTTKLLNNHAEC